MRKMKLIIFLLMLLPAWAMAQNKVITGRVADSTGQGVSNATIRAKGNSASTTANEAGSFTITVPSSTRILIISAVNYEEQEVSIGNSSQLDIQLRSRGTTMSEVVVIAYGTQIERRVTGSQAKISGDKIKNIPLPSVDQMLQGKVAGVQALAISGQPGAFAQLRIRGIGSINASSEPLFVVD